MRLILHNKHVKVDETANDYSREALPIKKLKSYLAVKLENAHRSEKYVSGKWDGRIRFFNSRNNTFPLGLIEDVLNYLHEYDIELVDARVNKFKFDRKATGKLRDNQEKCVKKCINNKLLRLPFYNGIINGATNYGKTYIMDELYKRSGKVNTLILIHNIDLFNSLSAHFINNKYALSQIDKDNFSFGGLTIAMYKTLLNKVKRSVNVKRKLAEFNMLFVDECHRAGAKDYQKLLRHIPAYANYFFSGTALQRKNAVENLRIVGASGKIIFKIKNKDLIDQGYSNKPIVYIYKNLELNFSRSYQYKLKHCIYESPYRLAVIKDYCNFHSKVLIAVRKKKHGDFLCENLEDAKTLYSDTEGRADVIDQFKNGKFKVIITTIMREGLNIKGIDCLIHAQGGKSIIELLQLTGRALRKSDAGSFTMVDFNDVAEPFDEHSTTRMKLWESEGFEIKKGLTPEV